MYLVPTQGDLPFRNLIHPAHTNNVHVGHICLAPGKHLMAHHHGYGQVYHIYSVDRALVQIGDDSQEITEPCVIWLPPNWEHAVRNIGARDLRYVYFNSWPDRAAKEDFLQKEKGFFLEGWEKANAPLAREMGRFEGRGSAPVLIPHPFAGARTDDGLGPGF